MQENGMHKMIRTFQKNYNNINVNMHAAKCINSFGSVHASMKKPKRREDMATCFYFEK